MKKKGKPSVRFGFPCPKCNGKSSVYKTQSNSGSNLARIRICESCRHVFDTIERLTHQDERARIRAVVSEVLDIERNRNQQAAKYPSHMSH